MNNGPDYSEATISIGSVEFDKKGSIYFNGFVEGIEFEKLINADEKDFEKFFPGNPDLEHMDPNDLYNATLDVWNNLHWLASLDGNIVHKVVRLKPIITEILYELYAEQS